MSRSTPSIPVAPEEGSDHPRTYSLVGSPRLFLVTDDESGINIGYADKIGGPLIPEARPTPVEPEAPDPRPCKDCGKPHPNNGPLDGNGRRMMDDWRDANDKHAYWPPSWEDYARSLARRLAVEPDGLPLDVERLAVAIRLESIRNGQPLSLEASRLYAHALNGEYARLASTPSEAKP